MELGRHVELVSVTSLQSFRRDPYDALAPLQVGASSRLRFDQAAEVRFHGEGRVRWELRPSARLTVSHGALRYHEYNAFQTERADVVAPTFRVGSVVSPSRAIAVRAAVHYGIRLPSLLELFGDRAGLLASRGLEPERSLGGDVGTTIRHEGRLGSILLDATGAIDRRYDLIQLRKTSQYTAKAENVGRAWVATVELLVRATLTSHLRFDLQTTYLFSRTERGGAIPLQPSFGAFGRVEAGTSRIGLLDDLAAYTEVMYVGANYVDSANLERFDPRTRMNAGVRLLLFARSLSASFEVVDVLDRAGFDLLGFPLPGRRYAAQIEYRKDL
jgi:hypothetical protein